MPETTFVTEVGGGLPLTLADLVDLSLATPEIGNVNFKTLRVLLHLICDQLGIGNTVVPDGVLDEDTDEVVEPPVNAVGEPQRGGGPPQQQQQGPRSAQGVGRPPPPPPYQQGGRQQPQRGNQQAPQGQRPPQRQQQYPQGQQGQQAPQQYPQSQQQPQQYPQGQQQYPQGQQQPQQQYSQGQAPPQQQYQQGQGPPPGQQPQQYPQGQQQPQQQYPQGQQGQGPPQHQQGQQQYPQGQQQPNQGPPQGQQQYPQGQQQYPQSQQQQPQQQYPQGQNPPQHGQQQPQQGQQQYPQGQQPQQGQSSPQSQQRQPQQYPQGQAQPQGQGPPQGQQQYPQSQQQQPQQYPQGQQQPQQGQQQYPQGQQNTPNQGPPQQSQGPTQGQQYPQSQSPQGPPQNQQSTQPQQSSQGPPQQGPHGGPQSQQYPQGQASQQYPQAQGQAPQQYPQSQQQPSQQYPQGQNTPQSQQPQGQQQYPQSQQGQAPQYPQSQAPPQGQSQAPPGQGPSSQGQQQPQQGQQQYPQGQQGQGPPQHQQGQQQYPQGQQQPNQGPPQQSQGPQGQQYPQSQSPQGPTQGQQSPQGQSPQQGQPQQGHGGPQSQQYPSGQAQAPQQGQPLQQYPQGQQYPPSQGSPPGQQGQGPYNQNQQAPQQGPSPPGQYPQSQAPQQGPSPPGQYPQSQAPQQGPSPPGQYPQSQAPQQGRVQSPPGQQAPQQGQTPTNQQYPTSGPQEQQYPQDQGQQQQRLQSQQYPQQGQGPSPPGQQYPQGPQSQQQGYPPQTQQQGYPPQSQQGYPPQSQGGYPPPPGQQYPQQQGPQSQQQGYPPPPGRSLGGKSYPSIHGHDQHGHELPDVHDPTDGPISAHVSKAHMDHGILKDLQGKLESIEDRLAYILSQIPVRGSPEAIRRSNMGGEAGRTSHDHDRQSMASDASHARLLASEDGTRLDPSAMSQSIMSEAEEEAEDEDDLDDEQEVRLGSYNQEAGADDALFANMMEQMNGIQSQQDIVGKHHKKKKKRDKGAKGDKSHDPSAQASEQALQMGQDGEKGGLSVNDMWQMIQLNNRLGGAEGAIQKMATLMEELARELARLRWDTETTQAPQEDTLLFGNDGLDNCMGAGICRGHGMPAGIAVCQFTDPAETTTKVDKPPLPDDACPNCGKDYKDKNDLANLKKPRKVMLDNEEAPAAATPGARFAGPQHRKTSMDDEAFDLEEIRENFMEFDFGEFDEKDVQQRIKTLWEAVKLLKSGDDILSKRIDKNEQLIKKIPKDRLAKTVIGDYTDPNPSGMMSSGSPAGGTPTSPQVTISAPISSQQPKVISEDVDPDNKDDDDSGVEEDIQTLFNNLANVIAECAEQKDRIDQLVDAVRIIEAGMVSKQFLLDMISDKADKGQINTKVSYDEFGNTVDELHVQLHNLMVEGYQRNENWKKVTSDLAEELSEKLDKVELSPIRAFFKSRLKKLEDRVASLAKLMEQPDPAGTRHKLLKDFNCISCDRKVNVSGFTNTCVLPTLGGSSALASSASHRAYDLHRLRTQRSSFDADAKKLNELENQMKTKSGNLCYSGKQERQLTDKEMIDLVNRYVGNKGDGDNQAVGGTILPPLASAATPVVEPEDAEEEQEMDDDLINEAMMEEAAMMEAEAEAALRMSGEYMQDMEE